MNVDSAMSQSTTPATLRLAPELTIYSAAQVRQELLDALGASASLTLDLSGVCELDSAGVQLLLAASRHARSHGGILRLRAHAPAVQEAFKLLGLPLDEELQ